MAIASTSFDDKYTHGNIDMTEWVYKESNWSRVDINKHAKSVTDVESCRGTDADGDHILVITEIKQKRATRYKQVRKQQRK